MPLIQTSAPGIEPVDLATAKNHLRLDSDLTADDALVNMLITAARAHAEMQTGRSFVQQGWRLVMNSFPGAGMMGVRWGVPFDVPPHAIVLERAPLIAVTGITYTAMDGTTQTMPSSDYVVDGSWPAPLITPVFGKIWPIPMPQIGSVRVDYTAGYGPAATDVPAGIRNWILMRVKSAYDMRGEVAIAHRGRIEPLPWVDGLLDPYKVYLG
jgi:uncharacterized phiE125 gp8 family phage protein